MNDLAQLISAKTKDCAFQLATITEFLDLLKCQQKQYSDISYHGNGALTLVLTAKKNKITKVVLKVIELNKDTAGIEAIEKDYSKLRSMIKSDYFIQINDQFYLTKENCSKEEQNQNPIKRFFVQESELCSGTLSALIESLRQNKQEIPDNLKETLAIQMLDAINLLHSRFVIHRDIKPQNFLVSQNKMFPIVLKLCNLGFASPKNLSLLKNSISGEGINKYMAPEAEKNKCYIESDLFSFALILLQLDNIFTFDYQKVTYSELSDLNKGIIFQNHQLNRSSLLYNIATTFLQYQPAKRESAHVMLLSLLKKSKEYEKIPIFSLVLKSQIDSFETVEGGQYEIPYKISEQLENLPNSDLIMVNIINTINKDDQNKRQLTTDLIKGALKVMMQWKEYGEEYELLGSGTISIVFGVKNLKCKRKAALKLQLCLNKADTIREIGIMRICQTPYIVEFYGYQFFSDEKGNNFVVFELERCKYSLKHYLEQQRIVGEYSYEQKYSLMQQIIDSVSFVHENRILHGDLKLDNFLVTENQEGQVFVKLTNFDQAWALMSDQSQNFLKQLLQENMVFSPNNYIINKFKKGTLLYYSPERWENGNPSTYKADNFSLGLILIILDNYLSFSEDHLLNYFYCFTKPYSDLVVDNKIKINTTTEIYEIAKDLLHFSFKERQSINNKIQQVRQTIPLYSKKQQFPIEDNSLQQTKSLNLTTRITRDTLNQFQDNLKKSTGLSNITINLFGSQIKKIGTLSLLASLTNLSNLTSISLNLSSNQIEGVGEQSLLSLSNLSNLTTLSLNLSKNQIGDTGTYLLLSPLSKLNNLTNITLCLESSQIGTIGAQSLLSPLNNLSNLASLSLNLSYNQIGAIGAQSLLSPLRNLSNLIKISLDLSSNKIGDDGASTLLSPLSNLSNLASIQLNLFSNAIGEIGAQSLLSPLKNLCNLTCISLDLSVNKIGDIGAQSILSPLRNLSNFSNIKLGLMGNEIGNDGAKQLLSPLSNLINLTSISLSLEANKIGSIGGQLILSPLRNLNNLTSILLNFNYNQLGDIGAQSLLSPLSNLSNLTCISLTIFCNQIGDIGAQSLLSPLRNLSNLARISLVFHSNKIGTIGAQSLLLPLCNLNNLTSLSLDIDHEYKDLIGSHFKNIKINA